MSDANTQAERRHVFHAHDGPPDTFDAAKTSSFAMRLAGPAQRWSLRTDDTPASVAPAHFDIGQPINVLRETVSQPPSHSNASRLSARLGPDEWLLIAQGSQDTALTSEISAAFAEHRHELVDISHRNIAIEVTGAGAADVLNTGCPLDLHETAFAAGSATRTLFAKTEIVLMRRHDVAGQPLYRIECWRSFGRYLFAHLADSATLLGLR